MGQAAIAAGVAWYLAHNVIGHERAFFAPIAALIALGVAATDRMRRVVELTFGVAVGIGIGDLLIAGIGSGAWQLGVVVFLAMTAAVILGGGPLFVSQAAASAVLVATLVAGNNGSRFVDALVGGAVGLGVLIVVPANPVRVARRVGAAFFVELAAALDDIAAALEERDVASAREALARTRAVEPLVGRWREALNVGSETALLSPPYWRARSQLAQYSRAAAELELATRNARALARAAIRAVELDSNLPAELPAAVSELAAAIRASEDALEGPDRSQPIGSALRATALASRALERDRELPTAHVVGQIRSTATDLLPCARDRADACRRARSTRGRAATRMTSATAAQLAAAT